MPIVYILLLLVVLTVVLLSAVPIRFQLKADYTRQHRHVELHLILLYGLIRFTYRYLPGAEKTKKVLSPGPPFTVADFTTRVREFGLGVALLSLFVPPDYTRWVASFSMTRSQTRCVTLDWVTRLGVGDAALTAVSTGVAYSLIGVVLAYIQSNVDFARCRRRITVLPSYGEACLETSVNCILDLKVGNIIFAGFRNYLLHLLRRKE